MCKCLCHVYALFYARNKYRGHRAMDEFVHDNEHRMAARGNATSFPLPWQYLLEQLTDGAQMEELGRSAALPRTGEELAHVVSILLKTSKRKRRR